MSQKFRQTLIGLIWPGPIAGPFPLNLFRLLAPALVFYISPILAAIVMGFLTSLTSVFYFRLLELSGGRKYVEGLLDKFPLKIHKSVETKGPLTLFVSSLLVGVFTYAIFLKLINYRQPTSEKLLVVSSFVSAAIWTGIFWGSVVGALKRLVSFAF